MRLYNVNNYPRFGRQSKGKIGVKFTLLVCHKYQFIHFNARKHIKLKYLFKRLNNKRCDSLPINLFTEFWRPYAEWSYGLIYMFIFVFYFAIIYCSFALNNNSVFFLFLL